MDCRTRMWLGVLASALVLVLSGRVPDAVAQAVSGSPALVFDGVTVVDVEQGKLLPAQRVVIAGNRIQAVGEAGAVATPKDAQVVDARGKYLIPGLWDLHVHTTAGFPYSLLIANGITGFRDGWSYVPLDTMLQWRREILAGTRVGPPRQLLTGDYASLNTLTEEEVAARKASGANFIKLYPFTFEAAAAARHAGVPFGGHVNEVPAMEASDSGMSILDHVNSAGGLDTLCMGPQATIERCRPVAERFRRNNSWWVSTLIHRMMYNTAAQPNPGAATEAVRDRFVEMADRFWSGTVPASDWLRGVTHVNGADTAGFLSVIQRAGLPILAGTDSDVGLDGMRRKPPGFSLHAELAIYMAEGLTPLNALQSATLNPAKMFRATDSLGTVAPGKLADLVLLDADPLTDIANTTTIRAVVANGRYFDRAMLDRLLAEVQAKGKAGFTYWWNDARREATSVDDTP